MSSYVPPRRKSELIRANSDPFITNIIEEPYGFEDSSVSSVEGSEEQKVSELSDVSGDASPTVEDVKSAANYNIQTVRRMDSDVADNLQAFGKAYASKFSFWKSFIMSGFLGAIMGFLAFGFFWLVHHLVYSICIELFSPKCICIIKNVFKSSTSLTLYIHIYRKKIHLIRAFNLGLTNFFFTKTYQTSLVSTHFHPEPYWIWLPVLPLF